MRIFLLLTLFLLQHFVVSAQTQSPDTSINGEVFLSYSNSDYNTFPLQNGISYRTKKGLIYTGLGLGSCSLGGILLLSKNEDTQGDGLYLVVEGLAFFIYGSFVAIIGGAGDYAHYRQRKNHRLSLIAPSNNQVGIAFNF